MHKTLYKFNPLKMSRYSWFGALWIEPLSASKVRSVDYSVARTFLSEFADFCLIYRQIRQVFSPKSRKIRQFLPIFYGKIDPLPQKFWILLHFYALIFFKIQKFIFFFIKLAALFRKKNSFSSEKKKPFVLEKKSLYFGRKFSRIQIKFHFFEL